jgi:hypothetical protein
VNHKQLKSLNSIFGRALRSTTLTIEDEAVVVAFWHHTLLALHDCLFCPSIAV